MSSAEIASTVTGQLFTPSTAIRRDAIYHSPAADADNKLADIRRSGDASTHTIGTLDAIASSSLSEEQKDALIRLTAYVDEREKGNPSFMDDIATLVRVLEASGNPAEQQSMTLDEARTRYDAERDFLSYNNDVELSFAIAIEQVSSQFISPQNRQERDFLAVATTQDMERAFALARDVLGRSIDMFV